MGRLADLEVENKQLRNLLDSVRRSKPATSRQLDKDLAKARQLDLPQVVRYPLAEFAEGRGRNVPLPDTVAEFAEVIGRGNAVRLVEGTRATGSRKWRRQLYIPRDMHDDHRIAKIIGREAADLLSHSHANCNMELPGCFNIL